MIFGKEFKTDQYWKPIQGIVKASKVKSVYFSPTVLRAVKGYTLTDLSSFPGLAVIHKDDAHQLPFEIRESIIKRKLVPLYANPVFVVFKRKYPKLIDMFIYPKVRYDPGHLNSFWERISQPQHEHVVSVLERNQCKPAVYVGNNMVLTVYRKKYKMYVRGDDISLSPHIIIDGEWESWIFEVLSKIVQPGWVIFDVGAHFGDYTLPFADWVKEEGRVFSFEANPLSAQLLSFNIDINGYSSRVKVFQLAVWDKKETLEFAEIKWWTGSSKAADFGTGTLDVKKFTVNTITVDEIVEEEGLERLDLIKMDIEGAEPRAINGASKTITRFLPLLVLEIGIGRESMLDMLRSLVERGYQIYLIGENRKLHPLALKVIDKGFTREIFDVLCVPKQKIDLVPKDLILESY